MLIICFSISVNLFLRYDLFMISLLTKGVWFARTYHLFIRTCLRIASSRAALNWSNWRFLFSEVIWIILFLTSNINASLQQKSVYNSDMSQYLFFVFYRKLSLLLTSFYENLTTQFLLSQNFESFLVCLLLDQCKKEHKHIKEWAIPKKLRGLRYTFLKKAQGICRFVILPLLKIGNSVESKAALLKFMLWKFQDQKPRPMEIPHYFFLISHGNLTF